ncbi:MAG: hypothetical protein HYT15_02930 [Candidatus Magasanikbacteria bacterium]|nr:hypothetical protein [Candidatus Magasanikbacteria bacterium]
MFRHKQTPSAEEPANPKEDQAADSAVVLDKNKTISPVQPEASLKELIEKNLKWSQIIYEQNRKINNKLLWIAIGGWVKILLILLPLIAAILFLPPLLADFWSGYSDLLGNANSTSTPSFDTVIKLFNLDPARQEQLKALLK